jgi:hypothetical protein
VKARYTYLGDSTIEIVMEDSSIDVNILPPSPASEPSEAGPTSAQVVAPLELCAPTPAPTPKQRTVKGIIRTMWTAVFSFGGEALVYGLNNLTALNLPPGVGLAVGALGYGAKAAIFPNTKL